MPVGDGFDSLLSPDLITVPHRREVMLKKPLAAGDAAVAALQLLTELRVRAALAQNGAAAEVPAEVPAVRSVSPTPATSANIYALAPNRADARTEREPVGAGRRGE